MADKMIAPKDGAEPKKTKTSPGEFFNQVRAETNKIVWPTREETVRTAIFVFIFMLLLSIFFLGVDTVFGLIVNALIGLLK
jgi:preprotein translocase subunit SecE